MTLLLVLFHVIVILIWLILYWLSSLYPQFTACLNANNNLKLLSAYVGWLWELFTAPCILGLELTDSCLGYPQNAEII